MDSPLIWAGSKRWLVSELQKRLGFIEQELSVGTRRLVELFAGGASVSLGLEPKYVLLNDTNPHLMNFWRHVSRGIITGQIFQADDAEFYHVIRDHFNRCKTDGGGQAERFYALNRWCFNGLWRVNKGGAFNVPRRTRTVALPAIPDCRQLMEGWTFTCQDFRQVILQPSDVVFADPPYDDGFTAYTVGQFCWPEQVDLAANLAVHEGPVIATNKATRRMQELYHDWGFTIELREGTQRMQNAQQGIPNLEMIAYKNC